MDGWQILENAIPRGSADAIGQMLGVHPDLVRRWRREPESGDAPTESGRRSPHDRERDFIRAVHSENPEGARLLVEDLVRFYLSLEEKQGRGLAEPVGQQIEESLRTAQAELKRAIEAMATDRKFRCE